MNEVQAAKQRLADARAPSVKAAQAFVVLCKRGVITGDEMRAELRAMEGLPAKPLRDSAER